MELSKQYKERLIDYQQERGLEQGNLRTARGMLVHKCATAGQIKPPVNVSNMSSSLETQGLLPDAEYDQWFLGQYYAQETVVYRGE